MLGIIVVFGGLSAPAQAANGNVGVTIAPAESSVPSGMNIPFEVSWQCGDVAAVTCDGASLIVEIPLSQPDGIAMAIESYLPVEMDGVQYPASIQDVGGNRKIIWTFPTTMAPGSAGTVGFVLRSQNWVTPNNTTIAPVATFSTSLGSDTRVSDPATITSDATVKVVKTKSSPALERPYLDSEVTYKIEAGFAQQWGPSGGRTAFINLCSAESSTGIWALQNLKLIDDLPAGATFVRASNGGVYNAAAHTVTWDLGSAITAAPGTEKGYTCNRDFDDPVFVTVIYPKSIFEGDVATGKLQRNDVHTDARAWLRPNAPLPVATSYAQHPLQDGGDGEFTMQKGYAYSESNQRNSEFSRGARSAWGDWGKGFLYRFDVEDKSQLVPGKWSLTDTLPCGFTSPTDNRTDCATPAFTGIAFGANRAMSELSVSWKTNLGRSGSCVIPEGSDVGDSTMRFCAGLGEMEEIPMGAGEWITQFSLDNNDLKVGTDGSLFVFGTVSPDLPLDNSNAVANGEYQEHFYTQSGLRAPGVTPASEHPLWLTVENCAVDNTITWAGGSASQNGSLVDPDHRGRCGYLRIIRTPLELEVEKRIYNPTVATTIVDQQKQGTSLPGSMMRVDMLAKRTVWDGATQQQIDDARFTPVFTEILPENMEYAPLDPAKPLYLSLESPWGDDYPEYGRPESAVIAKLGEPRVTVTQLTLDGKQRTQIVVDFPNAPADGGLLIADPEFNGIGDTLKVGFDVRVKAGTATGNYRNYTLTQAKEASNEYLRCATPAVLADPKIVDPATNWGNLDFDSSDVQGPSADSGCRATKPYTVLEAAGVSTAKLVKGTHDAEYIPSPGIGSTDKNGAASYQVPVRNSGNVNIRDVVLYDILPQVGDTGVRPGAGARGSAFDVFLTGPVTGAPSGAVVQYSKSANPCRGDLAGDGGGARSSAPAGCTDDWSSATPSNWADVTGFRVDFGTRVWLPLENYTLNFPAKAGGNGDFTKVAWNNVAVAGNRASDGRPMLPTEAPKVGLQLSPDLSWRKVDGADNSTLLAGSKWRITPVVAEGAQAPAGVWPREISDCQNAGCNGEDRDPAIGKFLLTGVPWGSYLIEEIEAPAGYEKLAQPRTITVGPGGLNTTDWTYELGAIANFKPGVDVSWEKVDPSLARLSGSAWELVQVDAAGVPVVGGTRIAIADCVAASAAECSGADTDPVAGKFHLRNVPGGSYHLIETQAPAGFKKLDEAKLVTVTADTALVIGQIKNEQIAVPPLPFTGGIGSYLFMIGGGLFLALTLVFAIRSGRARKNL